MTTQKEYLEAKKIVADYENSAINQHSLIYGFTYEPTNQDNLHVGTLIYNFVTKEEDVIVDYKEARSAISAKGRHFHPSAHALGGGWKAVKKFYVMKNGKIIKINKRMI